MRDETANMIDHTGIVLDDYERLSLHYDSNSSRVVPFGSLVYEKARVTINVP